MKRVCMVMAIWTLTAGFVPLAQAGQDMPAQTQSIDGYDVSFHIMRAQAGKEMGGSHDVMVKIERGGKSIADAAVNSKVIFPGGKAQSKMMMRMGEWYMAGYDLAPSGKHQVMILFKTADGAKHNGGIYYEGRAE